MDREVEKFKIIIFGDESLGKTTLVNEYLTKMFDDDKKITIGVDFYVKELEINGKNVLLQLWDLRVEERFRFLRPTYCLGANAALLLYDVTRSQTLDNISEWINIVHQKGGDIPIIMVGVLTDGKNKRQISAEEAAKTAKSFNLNGYIECNLKTGKYVEEVFEDIARLPRDHGIDIVEKNGIDSFEEISSKTGQNVDKIFEVMTDLLLKPMKEYKINEFLSLRLERRGTQIYVKGERFLQCKQLVLNISKKDVPIYDEINSIDEAADLYQKRLYQNEIVEGPAARPLNEYHNVTPEQEFWGHCSNLQAWYENDYDTRLLHSNLAFNLLKALVEAGDPNAKRVFKTEVAERFGSGYPNTIISIINANLLDYFSLEEKRELILPNVPVILKSSPHLFENGFISSDDPLLEEAKEGLVRSLRELGELGPGVSRKLELEESKKVEEGRKEEEEKVEYGKKLERKKRGSEDLLRRGLKRHLNDKENEEIKSTIETYIRWLVVKKILQIGVYPPDLHQIEKKIRNDFFIPDSIPIFFKEEIKQKTERSYYDILFVEGYGYPDTITLPMAYFGSKGYSCQGVCGGKKGFEELNNNIPKVILLDIILPDFSGYEICKQIKSNPKWKDILVFFFTSLPSSEVKRHMEETGADGYILKPFAFSDLDIILNLLGTR